VIELVRAAPGHRARGLIAVTFTHCDHYMQEERAGVASLGKAYLMSHLQALLQAERLKLSRTAGVKANSKTTKSTSMRLPATNTGRSGSAPMTIS
jgi:hypothetical protein